MHLLWTLIIGLIVGALAKLLMPPAKTLADFSSRFALVSQVR